MKNTFEIFRLEDGISYKHSRGNIKILGNKFHSNYEIFYLIEGSAEFTCNGTKRIINNNTLILINPGTYHQFAVISDIDCYERCVIEFNRKIIESLKLDKYFESISNCVLEGNDCIIDIFNRLNKYLDEKYNSDFNYLLNSAFIELAINLDHIEEKQHKDSNYTNLSKPVIEALDYIEAHKLENIDLKKLAENTFSSVSTVSHYFKKELGISVIQYIKQKKLIYARFLIRNGEKPTDVAKKIGYSDYSVFYKNYKAYFGVKPSIILNN